MPIDPVPELVAAFTVPRLLSVASVAEVLACSPRTVRRRIDDGSLPAVLEHGRIMVPSYELNDYIRQLKLLGAPPARRRLAGRDTFDFLRD